MGDEQQEHVAELAESMAGTMDDPQMVGKALMLLERSLGGRKKQKEMGDPNEGDPSKMPEHDDSLDEGTSNPRNPHYFIGTSGRRNSA